MRRAWIGLALVLFSVPVSAQPVEPPSAEDVSIQAFLQAVEASVLAMDRQRWTDLLSATADRDESLEFFESAVPEGVTRAVVKERDRVPLAGTLPGDGFRLTVEVFIETGPRGRIATWSLDIRKPRGGTGEPQPWRMAAAELAVVGRRACTASSCTRTSSSPRRTSCCAPSTSKCGCPPARCSSPRRPTGSPPSCCSATAASSSRPKPKEERGQVRIFAGAETLDARLHHGVRAHQPVRVRRGSVGDTMLTRLRAVDPRAFRRAQQVFDEEIRNSFSLDLSDLSRETWSLLPQSGDFVAEVRTRRYDKLTFARASSEPEDVSLFQRARKRNISLYASEQKLAVRGQFYDEDTLVDYDVLDYTIDAAFSPEREWMEGRTRLKLRVRAFVLGAITLKLADSLTVNSVVSEEMGRLLFLRVTNQNSFVINLPTPVPRDTELTLHVSYQGRLADQSIS